MTFQGQTVSAQVVDYEPFSKLIRTQQYNSAYAWLEQRQSHDTLDEITLRRIQLLLQHHEKQTAMQTFRLRDKGGDASSYWFAIDTALLEIIHRNPTRYEAHFLLGKFYDQVATHFPVSWIRLPTPVVLERMEHFYRTADAQGYSDAESLLRLGQFHLETRNAAQAAQYLERAAQQSPDSAAAYYYLAHAYAEQAEWKKATDAATQAYPKYTHREDKQLCSILLADLYQSQSQWLKAAEWLYIHKTLVDKTFPVQLKILHNYLDGRYFEEATTYTDTLYQAFSTNPQVLEALVDSYAARTQLPRLIQFFEAKIRAADAQAHEQLGALHFFMANAYLLLDDNAHTKHSLRQARTQFEQLDDKEEAKKITSAIDAILKNMD